MSRFQDQVWSAFVPQLNSAGVHILPGAHSSASPVAQQQDDYWARLHCTAQMLICSRIAFAQSAFA
jgi:hypothetical protein